MKVLLNLHPGIVRGNDEAGNAPRIAVLAPGAGKDHIVGGHVHARVPHFLAVDEVAGHPIADFRHGVRIHPGGVGAMPRLRQAEGHAALPGDGVLDELLLLRFRAEITHHA